MSTTMGMNMLFKPPTFDGKKKSFLQWKLRFQMHVSAAGCAAALNDNYKSVLPAVEDVSMLDPVRDAVAIAAVKSNALVMQALVCALDENNMNHAMVEIQADKDWPTGKAHRVWSRLLEDYQPDDITSEVELEQALMKIKLAKGANPKTLVDKLASLEAQYCTTIPESKKKAIVWNAASGAQYGSIVTVTNDMTKLVSLREATAQELCTAMHRQWRMTAGNTDDGDAGVETGETALASTNNGKFSGTCFLCKKAGHRKADCPTKGKAPASTAAETAGAAVSPNNGGGGGRKFQGNCNFCDRKGHKEEDCWKKFPEKSPFANKGKETAAATVTSELLVCAIDRFDRHAAESMEVLPGNSFLFTDISFGVPTEVECHHHAKKDLEENDNDMLHGEQSIARYLEARLRAAMCEPGVFICGEASGESAHVAPADDQVCISSSAQVSSPTTSLMEEVMGKVGTPMVEDVKEKTMETTSISRRPAPSWIRFFHRFVNRMCLRFQNQTCNRY